VSAPNKLNLKILEGLIREEIALINEGTFGDRLVNLRPDKEDEEGGKDKKSDNDNASEEKDEPKKNPDDDVAKKIEKRGIKALNKGTINTALNQLRNQKIDAKRFREAVVKAVKTIHKAAGPQRKNFAKEDAPVIQKIGKEVIKILSGDFSNLVKESQNIKIKISKEGKK
jgi:hypothetical protein